MTKYIKTAVTEFGQFNGSDEMCEKYGAEYELVSITDGDPNIPIDKQYQVAFHYWLKTLGAPLNIEIGDWIATGVNGEHWPVKDEIFRKTYKKLPKLTRSVSQYLEYCKEHWNLNDAFLNAEYLVPGNNGALEVFGYLSEHPDDFARAWLDGYEVAEVEE